MEFERQFKEALIKNDTSRMNAIRRCNGNKKAVRVGNSFGFDTDIDETFAIFGRDGNGIPWTER